MPEFLAPGVYVEETPIRLRTIEPAATGTAGFVGPTRRGPVGIVPGLLRSLGEFERIYGGADPLELADVPEAHGRTNFVAHSVRGFFENGGTHLYVARTVRAAALAAASLREADEPAGRATLRARFAGASYNGQVVLREVEAPVTVEGLQAATDGSLLSITSDKGDETLYVSRAGSWIDEDGVPFPLDGFPPGAAPGGTGASARLLTLTVEAADFDGNPLMWSRLGFAPAHPRWLGTVLAWQPPGPVDSFNHHNPVWADLGERVNAFALLAALRALPCVVPDDSLGRRVLTLAGGTDGLAPTVGDEAAEGSYAAALAQLGAVESIAVVAAPGCTAWPDGAAVQGALVAHAGRPGSGRIAVLDSAPHQTPADVRALRSTIDSSHAALYYPWVVVEGDLALPPSGFVAGIYARSDAERGVQKAPANEAVRGAVRFEHDLSAQAFEQLNPLGINCLRSLASRGLRVWGARTASSDSEWKLVPLRRTFDHVQASIERGTRWAVFEPNAEPLWAAIRLATDDFLRRAWRGGLLQGAEAHEAYFVRCDRTTMTQDDIENGRLVCEVGLALARPAEFVVMRIGQWTVEGRPP